VYGFLRFFGDIHCKFYRYLDGQLFKTNKIYKRQNCERYSWWRQHTQNDPFTPVQEKLPKAKVEQYYLFKDDLYAYVDLSCGEYDLFLSYTDDPHKNENISLSTNRGLKVAVNYKQGTYWTGRPDRNDEAESFELKVMGIDSERLCTLFEFGDDLNLQVHIPDWDKIKSPMIYHM